MERFRQRLNEGPAAMYSKDTSVFKTLKCNFSSYKYIFTAVYSTDKDAFLSLPKLYHSFLCLMRCSLCIIYSVIVTNSRTMQISVYLLNTDSLLLDCNSECFGGD